MKILKSTTPKTNLWGTPLMSSLHLAIQPLTTTPWLWPSNQLYWIVQLSNPYFSFRDQDMAWNHAKGLECVLALWSTAFHYSCPRKITVLDHYSISFCFKNQQSCSTCRYSQHSSEVLLTDPKFHHFNIQFFKKSLTSNKSLLHFRGSSKFNLPITPLFRISLTEILILPAPNNWPFSTFKTRSIHFFFFPRKSD